ncbi:MAG: PKD domain-containing protein, partial [Chitinophagaceae bacterium]
GIYTITLQARAWNGMDFITSVSNATIVVNARNTTERYFDPALGDDNNTGTSPASPLKTWNALSAWLNGANNRSAYIKRGETMLVNATLTTKKSGLSIGAYGTGPNPVLLADASIGKNSFIMANGTNAAIINHYYSDLDFDQNSSAGAAFFGYSDNSGSLSNVIFENCNLQNGYDDSLILTTGSGPKNSILLWNCNFDMNQGAKQNFIPYNTPYCAVMGGQQVGGNGNANLDHHMYINQCNHTLIRWVDFGTTISRNFCLNMNAPAYNSDVFYTLIDGCNITGTNNGIDFSNSNNDNSGHFSHVIVQNCAIHDLTTSTQGFGVFGYSIKDICIRYNRFYNNRIADIHILDADNTYLAYKNWFYTSASFPNTSINVVNGQQGSFTENVFVTMASANSLHFSGDFSNTTNWTIDYNEYWHPNINSAFYEANSITLLNFTQWQNLGYDISGLNKNPFFPNPSAGNFGQRPMANFDFTIHNGSVLFANLTTANPPNWSILYNWDFGDGNISTLANPTHNYQSIGTYLVAFEAINRCGTSTSIQNVNKDSILSTLEGENNKGIRVYPNPVTSFATIYFLNESVQVEVFINNTKGELMDKQKIVQKEQFQLDFITYPVGMYIITIKDDQTKQITTFKVQKLAH